MNARRAAALFLVNLNLCLLEVFSNKTRSFITAFGIFLGIAALLVNVAFIRAMDDDLKRNMGTIGGLRIITVTANEPSTPKEKQEYQRSPGLTPDQGERLAAQSPFIESFLAQREIGWSRVRAMGKRGGALVKAVGPRHLELYNYKIERGRPLSAEDHGKKRFVCLVGGQVAERLFGKGVDPIGQEISIRRYQFEIVGLIKTETIFKQQSRELLFPYSVYASKVASRFTPQSELTFLLKRTDLALEAQADLHTRLLGMHRGVEDFTVEVNQDKINEMKTASLGVKALLGAIALISLLVGGVSIMNIMFATIEDRIREIGIRKALGAKRSDIFTQFVIEAVLLSALGGLPGMLIGALVTLAPEGMFPYNPRLGGGDYALAIIFTVVVGLIAGTFPSVRAADMQPVEALRY
jgi:putative ABC transport system permease protein